MPDPVYEILEEDLSSLNSGRGRQITYGKDPEVTYQLPESEINIYSHEPTLEDLIHPFRPSGTILIEAFLDGRRKFFSASGDEFESLDRHIMERIEGLDSFRGYKQFNGF
jgi:hypothetical protein